MSLPAYECAPRPFKLELRPHGKFSRYVAIHPDGREQVLQRVTTILSTLNKEALIPWAVGQTLDACREKILAERAYTTDQLEQVWEWAKGAQYRTKTEAAAYGTRAHEIIEAALHAAGEWPSEREMAREPLPVQNSVALFQEWWGAQNLTVIDLEAYVADVQMGYGGTIDCLARDSEGRLVLLDWKTSKAVYPEYHLQVVAYGGAMARMGLGMPEQASILRIGKEDAEFESVPVWQSLDEARGLYQAWKALVQVSEWLKAAKAKSDAEWRRKKKTQKPAQEVAVA